MMQPCLLFWSQIHCFNLLFLLLYSFWILQANRDELLPIVLYLRKDVMPFFCYRHKTSMPVTQTKESTEMTLTIKKQASGLGLEIVGGSDTYLGEVVVKSIEPESAAAKDGRIAVGDRLVMVNGGSLRGMKHRKAVSTLRLASSPINFTIIREDPEAIFTSVEEPSRVFEVRLKKSITDYIGLSILARKDKKGVFVTYVSENGIAYKEGSIYQGDKILEVNGLNLKRSTQQEAFKSLRRAFGTVTLKIGRISSLHASLCTQSNSSGSHVNHALADDEESVITEKDTINTKTLENFGYLNPESIELSLQQHNQKKGTINREDYV